jgi:hypothetical protein
MDRISPTVIVTTGKEIGTLETLYKSLPRLVIASTSLNGVPVISWLPPDNLFSFDEPLEEGDESIGTLASLLLWATEPDAARSAREVKRLNLRTRLLDATDYRRAAILKEPFAVTSLGIVVANWFGDHKQGYRAFFDALATEHAKLRPSHKGPPVLLDHRILFDLAQEYRRVVEKASLPHYDDLPAMSLGPTTHAMTEKLVKHILGPNPNARLKPVYTLIGLDNEDLVRRQLQRLSDRIHHWFRALDMSPDEEAQPWINLKSKQRLLDLVDKGRFYLFEAVPGFGPNKGAIAYAPILSGRKLENYPLGVGVGVRIGKKDTFYRVDPLFLICLHEFAHVLDSGDPDRDRDKSDRLQDDEPRQHQPGSHDHSWNRAFQYNINLAYRAGLLADEEWQFNGENWSIDTVDSQYLYDFEVERVFADNDVFITKNELREELDARQGHKRLLEMDTDDAVDGVVDALLQNIYLG